MADGAGVAEAVTVAEGAALDVGCGFSIRAQPAIRITIAASARIHGT